MSLPGLASVAHFLRRGGDVLPDDWINWPTAGELATGEYHGAVAADVTGGVGGRAVRGPDERAGEGVVATATPAPGSTGPLADGRGFCRARLASYKRPRQLHVTDDSPRTPVGKPDYRWAKRIATQPASASALATPATPSS